MDENHNDHLDEEALSEFSYVPSETMQNLTIEEAKRNIESALLRKNDPLTLSSIKDQDHHQVPSSSSQDQYSLQQPPAIVKPELTPIIKDSPFSSIHSSPDFKAFQPPHLPPLPNDYRESYLSTISQYSGVPADPGAHAIPVTITRHDSGKATEKSKLVLINPDLPDESETTNIPSKPQSEASEFDSETIKIGKLPTIRGSTSTARSSPKSDASSNKLKPDVSYNTTIEGSVPPRSPRRPKSEILSAIQQNELAKEINEFNKNKQQVSHNKRNSAQISDDLDQLMKSLRRESTSFSDDALSNLDHMDSKSIKSNRSKEYNADNTTEPLVSHRVASAPPSQPSPSETDALPKIRGVPPRPSTENLIKAREVSESLQYQNQDQLQANPSMESESTLPTPPLPPPHGTGKSPITTQNAYVPVPVSNHNDDDYYDIEPPKLVHQPSRVKSVKDSTKDHYHEKKSKSIKTKKKKSRDSSELKPFSYHTLINLLESMNGTIIGEEFSQLNLPIKEKQLIEKIVDSLSRLTSDMVIDKNRYDIGIQRLEKALRVLEGFM
ncbi:hypothetical protein DFJ63DRAFT_138018 [Scheffersomyces coipomensis]|uniref:uncharacterized protein n=1 Tax=Scheffersomyces coipomensis TaxID=1788519 RepID=UPI00315DD6C7